MKKNIIAIICGLVYGAVAFADAGVVPETFISRDVPINTFTLRANANQVSTLSTVFVTIPGGVADIVPNCNQFGLSEPARASFCAVLPPTSNANQGDVRLSIAGAFSAIATFVADDVLHKGSQCFTWIIPDAQLTCGTQNNIVLQWRSYSGSNPFVLKQRTFTIDYFK